MATWQVEACGLPLIHDKTVDEWGTNGTWPVDDRATGLIMILMTGTFA
jgi:hypothetical protein